MGEHDLDVQSTRIELTTEGRLQLPALGLDLIPVGLTAAETGGTASVLAQMDCDNNDVDMTNHADDAGGWHALTNQAGQLRSDLTLPRTEPTEEPAASLLPQRDGEYLQKAAVTSEDLELLAPRVPAPVQEEVEEADPTLVADLRDWFDPGADRPKLVVLGPVEVRTNGTGKHVEAAGRKAYLTELVAYLATRPHGATTDEVAEAMGITTDRVRKDILALRSWLGVNPRTGRPHVPDSRQTAAARARGQGAYQIEDLLVDADLFRRLRARSEARGGDEGIDGLRRALTLVTGTPFAQLRGVGGVWLDEGDRIDQILLCAIVDVAHVVATAALHTGDLKVAQEAAELALRCAPDEEIPQLDLAAVLSARGHHQAAEDLLKDSVLDRSDDEIPTPTDLPQRSQDVINQRDWFKRTDRRASA